MIRWLAPMAVLAALAVACGGDDEGGSSVGGSGGGGGTGGAPGGSGGQGGFGGSETFGEEIRAIVNAPTYVRASADRVFVLNRLFNDPNSVTLLRFSNTDVVGEPTAIVSDRPNGKDLALSDDGEVVYWVTPEAVLSVDAGADEGETPIEIYTGEDEVLAMTAGGGVVYAIDGSPLPGSCDNGTIVRVPESLIPSNVVEGVRCATKLALDGEGRLYVLYGEGTQVGWVPETGGDLTSLYESLEGSDVEQLAADASGAYTLRRSGAIEHDLIRIPAEGGDPVVLATLPAPGGALPIARQIALDATHVYVASANRIFRTPKAGGRTDVLASMPGLAVSVEVQGDRVYYVNQSPLLGPGALWRVTLE